MTTQAFRIGAIEIRTAVLLLAVLLGIAFPPVPASGQEPFFGVPVSADGVRGIVLRHHFVHPLPDGDESVITYAPDGTTTLVLRSGSRFAGSWTVDDSGRLCLSWPEYLQADCFQVFLDGTLLRLVAASGRIAGETLLPGLPPPWLSEPD